MSHLVGVPVFEQYAWDYQGKHHLAIHGHQFDSFAVKNLFLSRIGQLIYLNLQKLDFKSKRFARYLDRLNTRWLRLSTQVAQGALSYAKKGKAERIFCGHTHVPMKEMHDGVEYYNSGAWVDTSCTYIIINQEGVSIHEFESEQIDDSYSGQERIETVAEPAGVALQAGLPVHAAYQSVRC
jgi:UDP-2,3-diacylglucosamine pyrophosphatase LpxH